MAYIIKIGIWYIKGIRALSLVNLCPQWNGLSLLREEEWYPHVDDQGYFPTLNTKRKGRRQSDFSEELMFIYQLRTLVSCCLIRREIEHVVPNQDIWLGKVLSVPRQVTESIVSAFICLYLGSNTSLKDEVGRIGGWWTFLGQVFQKLEQKWITFFKGTDSLDRRFWNLRSFATSCSC